MGVKVNGLDKALIDLEKKGDKIVDAVKDVLANTAVNIEMEASRNAPKSYQIGDTTINLSFIQQKINKKVLNNGLGYNVGLDVPNKGEQWEAWMEFGTGLSAQEILSGSQYTPEMKAQARIFFRNGKGRIIGKPYLYPAFFKNTVNLVDEMEKDIIDKLK